MVEMTSLINQKANLSAWSRILTDAFGLICSKYTTFVHNFVFDGIDSHVFGHWLKPLLPFKYFSKVVKSDDLQKIDSLTKAKSEWSSASTKVTEESCNLGVTGNRKYRLVLE
jgi:hypothetical protein